LATNARYPRSGGRLARNPSLVPPRSAGAESAAMALTEGHWNSVGIFLLAAVH
jgi:hypothetical protein